MDTYEIIPGNYNTEADVQVKFTTKIEVATYQTFSEKDVLNTIAYLEQQKLDFCALKDIEIATNTEMLLKIRAIDRTINTIE